MRIWLFFVVLLLLSVGNASAVNLIQNGDFGTGDLTGWTTTGSTVAVHTDYNYNSIYGVSIKASSGYTYLHQTIDLTEVDEISFDYRIVTSGFLSYPLNVDLGSGTEYYDWDVGPWESKTLDVSGVTGIKTLTFYGTANGNLYEVYIDNIIADDEGTPISIDTKITQNDEPLTSVGVIGENSTGGFPNEYGCTYLTPYGKDSKEYTIWLMGDDLAPGFELLVFADSADVSKLTIDVEDLDSTKTYDVFFDYEPLEKISGVSEIQYDITSFSWHSLELVPVQGVNLYGTVYNATSNATLASANVSLLQGSTYYNTTTDANGDYSVTNLSTNILINVNVIKSGYTHEDFSVTPLWAGNFKMDLYMFPTIIGVHGLVVDYPWHQVINGSTVWLWNATYNTSTATTSTGYYLITNITNGNYTMNASATGYIPSDDVNITVVDNVSVEYFILSQVYNLTVTAVDSQTEASIQSFSTTAGTETIDATNGSAVFSLGYGLYYVVVTATGYYPSYGHAFLDKNETLEIELEPIPSYYESHKVKFTVKSLWGTLYTGVDVNVYLGDMITPYNYYKNGTTGTDGAVAFLLTKDVQYTLTFIDESQSIDETITLYPVDNEYTVYTSIGNLIDDLLNPDDEEQAITAIDVSVTKTIINDNTANITVNYNDIMDETSGLTLTLSQSIAGNTTNKTILSTVDLGTTNNTAYNFTVTNYNGESYLIEIEATHTTHGAIYRMYGIQFENTDTLFGFTVEVVGWLAIIFITWFALTATSITVPHTAIGVCALATVMMAVGWGSYISVPGLGLAWIMAIGANMAHAKEASA